MRKLNIVIKMEQQQHPQSIQYLTNKFVHKYQTNECVSNTVIWSIDVIHEETKQIDTNILKKIIEHCESVGFGVYIIIAKDLQEIIQTCMIDKCTVYRALLIIYKIYNIYESVLRISVLERKTETEIKNIIIEQLFSYYPSINMHTFRYLYFHPTLVQIQRHRSPVINIFYNMIEYLVFLHKHDGITFEVTKKEMKDLFL